MTATADAGGRWRPTSLGLLGDERLARHAGAGDAQAFAIVYERYHHALYRYCRSILHHDADAQDALQSTFASAFAALRSGQRDAPMRPWLFRIAHNESISALRRRPPAFDLSAASERGTASVEDEAAGRAEVYLLLRDLRELTDRQRSALVLRELCGLSHAEIAIAVGTSVGGAKQMIFEARRALFEFAQGRDMACDEIRRTISDADGRSLRARRVRAHLRECSACAAFATAIAARTEELRALTPLLPASAAAAGLLGRIAVSHIGRGGGSGLARLAAGAAGKGATVGAGLGANALAGVAVVASATVGVTMGVDKFVHAISSAGAARAHVSATAANRTGSTQSSSWWAAPQGARSASGPRPAGVGTGANVRSAITILRRSTGSPAVGPGAGMAGTGAAAWPRGAVGSVLAPVVAIGGPGQGGVGAGQPPAAGRADGSAASSGASVAGRAGHGSRTSAGSGRSQSASSSSSTGAGRSGSSGSGHHGSSGSGRHGSSGSGRHGSSGSGGYGSGGSGNGAGGSDSPGSGTSGSTGSGAYGSAGSGRSHYGGSGPPSGLGNLQASVNTGAPGPGSGGLGAVTNTANHDAPGVSNAVGAVDAVSGSANSATAIPAPADPAPADPAPADPAPAVAAP